MPTRARDSGRSVVRGIVATSLGLLAATTAVAETRYVAVDLGTLGGTGSSTYAINNRGQVVGASRIQGDAAEHAFSWTAAEGMVDLGTLGGSASVAIAVNDDGLVVGNSETASGEWHAFSWTATGGIVDLGHTGESSYATGVNTHGMIVGSASGRTVLWESTGQRTDLGTLGGYWSYPVDMSDNGQVVGKSQTANGEEHAFSWTREDGMVDLGTLGGTTSDATAVNNSGLVVGWSRLNETASGHAFAWTKDGGMVDLGALSGDWSFAWAVSSGGQIVGESQSTYGYMHAFSVMPPAAMTDLGTLGGAYPGGVSGALAINDLGLIAGYSYGASGGIHAVVWSRDLGLVDLGTLCTDVSYCSAVGQAVNANGEVAGWSEVSWHGATHAALWRPETNNAPRAVVRAPAGFECARGTTFTLDGSASYDPDGDSLSYTWWWGTPGAGVMMGTEPTIELPAEFVASRTYTLVVDDGRSTGTARGHG